MLMQALGVNGVDSMDIISYLIGLASGKNQGKGVVTIDGDISCTDTGSGNIVIEEVESNG